MPVRFYRHVRHPHQLAAGFGLGHWLGRATGQPDEGQEAERQPDHGVART
jgi:hypothetical protein